MKKILYFILMSILVFTTSGCFSKDTLSNNNVYTSNYPIYFLTDYLYGNEKKVTSIYPNGADIDKYVLTSKQKETYQKGALFVYNGLTEENKLAREFLNNNKNLLLIDVSHGINYENDITELWLSPNNYLMLAKNIKNNLINYATSQILKDNLEKKYLELEEKLSFMDADLRNIANNAKENGNINIVSSSNKLKFLENYGFNVIVLYDNSSIEANIKSNFKSAKYKDVYLCDSDTETDLIKELKDSYKANIINVKIMNNLTDEQVSAGENYFTIMQDFIENIRNTALS